MIKNVNHVMFWAKNLERAKNWYKEKLEFEVSYFAPEEFLSMRHKEMGRMDFHGGGTDQDIGHGPLPYFLVEDIEKTKSWLESKNIRVNEIQQVGESPKHTWFYDSEGNILGLEEI